MNIYQLTRTDKVSYDEYDSMIVYANNETEALALSPDGGNVNWGKNYSSWATNIDNIKVNLIGVAVEDVEVDVILASFNAG